MGTVIAGIRPFTKDKRGEITVKEDMSTDGCVHVRMTIDGGTYRHIFLSLEDAKMLRKMIKACRKFNMSAAEKHPNEFHCRAIKSDFMRVTFGNGCRVHIEFHSNYTGMSTIYLSELGAQCLESKIKIVRKQIKGKASA
ncbi:hypothetical protein COM97_27080 [Bacillus thuringiensis]|uniref:hypothetical protein n=1 Tax=Bacillus thuringiensis TaxID=1428 RepID=UPI000BECAA26|nr:hypothetical protein [Bacillus thuringiensis]PEF03407.1 hypothetical protein COM97_27080 [Bacillus thuringiensis]